MKINFDFRNAATEQVPASELVGQTILTVEIYGNCLNIQTNFGYYILETENQGCGIYGPVLYRCENKGP